MLRSCVMDFGGSWEVHLPLIKFAYNNSYHANIHMAPSEALYRSKCRSPVDWFEIETRVIGPDLVQDAFEKVKAIQDRLVAAKSKQRANADNRSWDLEFSIRDIVFLKVSTMKGHMWFEVRGKLSPRYVGPYEIVERVGNVAYHLTLSSDLEGVQPVFHV